MPLTPSTGWTDRVVTAVPGLAALAYGFTLPRDVRVLFDAVLAVLCLSCFAIVLQQRATIRRWSARRAVRTVAALAAGAIVSLFLYLAAENAVVAEYDPYPPGRGAAVVQMLPARLHLFPPDLTFPYLDCREAMGERCDHPVRREAPTAADVVDLLSTHGTFDIKLPTGAADRHTATALLLTFFTLAAVQLMALSGVIRMRGITPRLILTTFAKNAGE